MSSMMPHNPLQTMLAGQCVMFNEVVRDAVGDLMRGQTEDIKLRVRPQICAAGKMLLANLAKFQQLQASTSAKLGGKLEAPAQTEPARPVAKAPSAPAADQAAAPESTPAPVPGDEPAAPTRDQPKAAVPPVTRRELTGAMAGRTRAEIDDALIAACRELPPQGRGGPSTTPAPGDTKQAKKVEELPNSKSPEPNQVQPATGSLFATTICRGHSRSCVAWGNAPLVNAASNSKCASGWRP